MIKKLFFVFSICTSVAFAQQPVNIGFELGNTTNWICGSGTFGNKAMDSCNRPLTLIVNYDGKCLDQGGINATNTPNSASLNRHILMSAGTDPNSFGAISCVAPVNLFPDNVNKYSFRLGNSVTGGMDPSTADSLAFTEGVKFKLQVDAANTSLTYLYALLIHESNPAHPPAEGARFIVKILDAKDSLIHYLQITATDNTLKLGAMDQVGQWKYTDWRKVKLNLAAFIGQTISIEFLTSDCFPSQLVSANNCLYRSGSHAAYAYLDMYCESIVSTIPTWGNNIAVDVYPNPFNTELNINIIGLSADNLYELKMYNYLGQEVKSQSLKNGIQKMNRGNLINGIYLIEIVDQEKVVGKKKIVIND